MHKYLVKGFTVVIMSMVLALTAPTLTFATEFVPIAVTNQSVISFNSTDAVLQNAVNTDKFGFGDTSKLGDLELLLVDPIAVVTIFSDSSGDSSGYVSGHSFITVKNVSGGTIQIGKFTGIADNKTMSMGTWGNESEHTGLWYNLESYYVYNYGAYSNRKSVSYILTQSELDDLNSYIINNDYWSYLTNCSSFATGAWNTAVDASYSLSAGVPNTPAHLEDDIIDTFPYAYQTGASVPWDYIVYYAQGTGTPIASDDHT